MAGFTSVLLAAGIGLQAYGQAKAGADAKSAANYNASIYAQQASIIDVKKGIVKKNWDRVIAQLAGKSVTAVAASGYDYSGSFLNVINDSMTQAYLDKQSDLYNLEVEKTQALSGASEQERAGSRARTSSAISSGSTILTGANEWYSKYGGFNAGSGVANFNKTTVKEYAAGQSLLPQYR